MQISVQKLSKSQTELKIEIPTEEFQKFLEKATLNLGKDLEVQGFRKGKAPKEVIEKQVGQEKILNTAAEDCVRENYLKAIFEKKLEPLGQPEIEILKIAPGNPFEFKARISVLPEIKLPNYRNIASKVKKREVKVTNEEIERLRAEKERIEKGRVRQEILDKIAQDSEIEIPEILLEAEKNRMLENLKQQAPQILRISFEEYLKKINKTEKELLESFLPEVQKRVKVSLVLKEIEKRENIEVSDEEIKTETGKILKNHPPDQNLDPERLKDYTKEVIRNEKTLAKLESFVQND